MAGSEVEAIYTHGLNGEAMKPVPATTALARLGLEGDRYFEAGGNESEAIEAVVREGQVTIEPAERWRNIVTRGVPLNGLVGREFRVGEVRLEGIRLYEPCKPLERITRPGVLKALVHRGVLRSRSSKAGRSM